MPGPDPNHEALERLQDKADELAQSIDLGGSARDMALALLSPEVRWVTDPDPGWIVMIRNDASNRIAWAFVGERA